MNIAKMLWPDICPFCLKPSKEGICLTCYKKLEKLKVKQPRCMRCGKPIKDETKEYCFDCMHTHHYYDRGVSLWLHQSPVNQSLYTFKYENQRAFAPIYAKEVLMEYEDQFRKWGIQYIFPVPLHKKRHKTRGYNQAALIARELGKSLGVPVIEDLLIRIHNTEPQKTLDPKFRKQNLQKAFMLRRRIKPLKSVLIVDDIYTTGNTIDAVAKILKLAGVQKVYFFTISIGQGY